MVNERSVLRRFDDLKQELRLIWSNHTYPLLVIDSEGMILAANPAAESTYGGSLEGERFDTFFASDEDFITFRDTGLHQEARTLNVRTTTEFGATFNCQFISSEANLIVIASATNHSQSEAQTKLLKENIKTNNLMRSLRQKTRELENLNEEKTRLLGTAAHDLRSPLSVIHGFTEVIEYFQESYSEEVRHALGRIKKVSSHALKLLNETLSYSQIQSGKIELSRETTDIRSIVRECVDLQKRLGRKQNIEVKWEEPESRLDLSVDTVRLSQALDNLLSNAIKHTAPGGQVTVRLSQEPQAAVISVTDQGPGIAEEELNTLFEPFRKGTRAATDSSESTGLGLAITKRLIELHGGQLAVESKPKEGATFSLRLPLPQGDGPP